MSSRSFFSRKLLLRMALYVAVLAGLAYAYFSPLLKSYSLYPASKKIPTTVPYVYDDREQKGTSFSVLQQSKAGLQLHYKLGNGFTYPYAGISLPVYFDLSRFNTLELSLSVPQDMKVSLILSQQKLHGISQELEILQHVDYLLHCHPNESHYSIPLSSFQTPAWWLKLHHVGEATETEWPTINTLSIQNDPALPNGRDQHYTIASIHLSNRTSWPLYTGLIFLLSMLLYEYNASKPKPRKTEIRYVPIEGVDPQSDAPWDKVAYFIATHYQEEISLESIYSATGVPKHTVTALMKEKAEMNFRQYVNEIRIREAERLFKETSLSVTEIGYEVGYSSATHFNRVFKDLKGMAPSEYRKTVIT